MFLLPFSGVFFLDTKRKACFFGPIFCTHSQASLSSWNNRRAITSILQFSAESETRRKLTVGKNVALVEYGQVRSESFSFKVGHSRMRSPREPAHRTTWMFGQVSMWLATWGIARLITRCSPLRGTHRVGYKLGYQRLPNS